MNLLNLNAWWGGGLGAMAVVSAAIGFAPAPPNMTFLKSAELQDRVLQDIEARTYAAREYEAYRAAFEQASRELRAQRNQFYYSRQYLTFERLSREAFEASGAAERATLENRQSLQQNVVRHRQEIRDMIVSIRSRVHRVGLSNTGRSRLTRAEVLLREAELLADAKEWHDAHDRMVAALSLTRSAEGEQQERMGRFQDAGLMRQWDRWVEDTLESSMRNRTKVVIVVKSRATCLVFDSGRLVRTYDADLGKNSVFDKNYRGDEATPEGKYRIIKKKGHGQSKYYKALLINYPNAEDIRTFRRARAGGLITHRGALGGLIEIHGGGGRDQNWTQGCVALENRDMDDIYARVEVGTPVTIVGNYSDFDRLVRVNQKS